MAFFRKEIQDPNQEAASSSGMSRNTGISDLQKLLEMIDTRINVHVDDNESVAVEVVDDEFTAAPIPPTSPEPYCLPEPPVITPVYIIRRLTFENMADFMRKMAPLLSQGIEMSQNQSNDLLAFLAQSENSTYRSKWENLATGMSQILANATNIKGAIYSVQEWDAFLNAFKQSTATNGFSINCYLTLHNQSLGNYLLNNEPSFKEINDAFMRYLKNREEIPNASQKKKS